MDFNEQIGDILFRGFWQGGKSENGVVNPKARINKKAPVSYAEAQAFKYKLGALKPHIIVVDYDTDESFYAAVKIAQSKGEHFIAIKGAHKGGHLYYYNNTKARTTSFCGTTNEEKFLNSDTGSRRWWVIHLAAEKTFDFEHILNGVELHQFWLQCYHLFSENAASFRLTDEEKQIMKIRNGVAMETKPAEDELMAWMDFDASKEKWVELTASDFIIQNPIFDRYTPKEIGAALSSLKKNYYPELQVRHGKKGNIWFMPPINRIWNSAIENAEKTVDDLVNR